MWHGFLSQPSLLEHILLQFQLQVWCVLTFIFVKRLTFFQNYFLRKYQTDAYLRLDLTVLYQNSRPVRLEARVHGDLIWSSGSSVDLINLWTQLSAILSFRTRWHRRRNKILFRVLVSLKLVFSPYKTISHIRINWCLLGCN